MHRRSRFLVGLTAAAITFASLWFTLGSERFNHGHRSCNKMEHCCMMNDEHNKGCCKESEPQKAEKVIIIEKVVKTDTIK